MINCYKKRGIGLSGGVATGKSTVASLLKQRGYLVIDADILARQSVAIGSPVLAELVERFGKKILRNDGSLDRKELRMMIFADRTIQRAVEAIIHPCIEKLLSVELQAHHLVDDQQLWFYEAALLVETGNYRQYRQLWICHCQRTTQIARLMVRDKVSRREAQQIIDAQLTSETKIKVADLVIDSDRTISDIELLIDSHLQRMS